MKKMQPKQPKLLPIQDFVDEGYLQEVNRQVFHVLGLQLVVDGDHLVVEDHRSEPEGVFFPEVDEDAAQRIFARFQTYAAHRKRFFQGQGPTQPLNVKVRQQDIDLYRRQNAPRKHMLNR